MAGYNRLIMVGNLTRDPELRQLASGASVCRLNVASNRQFKNRQTGVMTQEVCFVDVDVWGAQAESCNQYLAKGRAILLEGRLKFDTWQDAEGQNRSKHSIVADRVVFLSQGQSAETNTGATTGMGAASGAGTDATMAAHRDAAPQSQTASAGEATAPQADANEASPAAADATANEETPAEKAVPFKDEPPFQDDLPF